MKLEQELSAVLKGDPDAFLAVVREFGPMLRSYLGTQLFHQDEVEDLAQEVFIIAYQKLPSFRRGENFGAWLRGIARNKLLKHYEYIRRREDSLESFRHDAALLLENEFESKAANTKESQLQALLVCLEKLPQKMRRVVRGWLNDSRAAALAEELELSVSNIYQIQHRACDTLRQCIEKEIAHAE